MPKKKLVKCFEKETIRPPIRKYVTCISTRTGRQLRKGSKLYVEGQLTHRSYEDNTGQKKYVTEVKLSGFNSALQLLDTKGEAKGEMEIGDLGEPKPSQQPIAPVASDGFEDDIPF